MLGQFTSGTREINCRLKFVQSVMIMNKRNLFVGVFALLSLFLQGQNIVISTPCTQLLLSAPKGGSLEHLYYGSRTSDTDIHGIYETTHGVDALSLIHISEPTRPY